MDFASLYLERLQIALYVHNFAKLQQKSAFTAFSDFAKINGLKIILTLKIDDTIVRSGHRQIGSGNHI